MPGPIPDTAHGVAAAILNTAPYKDWDFPQRRDASQLVLDGTRQLAEDGAECLCEAVLAGSDRPMGPQSGPL